MSDLQSDHLPVPVKASWRPIAPAQAARIKARSTALGEAVFHPPRSPERRAAIAVAVAAGTPERTVRRWLADYDAQGSFGLARRKAADAGARRVVISKVFDAALQAGGGSGDLLATIAAELEQLRANIWASPSGRSGAPEVRRHLEHQLRKLCLAHGVKIAPKACSVSRRWTERDRDFRIVDIQKHDAKRFADGTPHISRDLTKGLPMLAVVADVKHLDLVMRRPDGSEAWPKIIAFQDRSTQRVFAYPLLLAPGEGVRQDHVIEAYIEMVSDSSWGFPQSLHLDNGSEFSCFERITGALNLVNEEARKEIVYARPYNAKAKTVEGWFRRADLYLFSQFPGYSGRERMNKKTQKVGPPTEPYPHDFETFKGDVAAAVAYLNSRPIEGQWGGKSANEWFADKVSALNWRPVMADPLLLDLAFCVRADRKVDRGAVREKGVRFTSPALHQVPHGTRVDVALSWRRGAPMLFRGVDGAWHYASPDQRRGPDDLEGARDAARRGGDYRKAIKRKAATVQTYDSRAAQREMTADAPRLALPASPDRLGFSGHLIELEAARKVAELAHVAAPEEAERKRRAFLAEEALLERKYGNVY